VPWQGRQRAGGLTRRVWDHLQQEEMLELGAEGLPRAPIVAVAPQVVGLGPRGEAAVGWRLELYTAPQCRWYRAEVLAFKDNGFHHLLYQDGEDEWVDLSREAVQWLTCAPLSPLGAGLPPGKFPPTPKPCYRGSMVVAVSIISHALF
jgi:hypothetical protein